MKEKHKTKKYFKRMNRRNNINCVSSNYNCFIDISTEYQ